MNEKRHRRRRSPKRRPHTTEVNEREEQPGEDETARDRTCPLCGKVCRSPQGLSLHMRSCRFRDQKEQAAQELSANDGNETEKIANTVGLVCVSRMWEKVSKQESIDSTQASSPIITIIEM
eukprot:Selendium_serpulae@DN4960_c2_g1_i1.p1